ncbi:MAG: hypothetical protein EOP49_01400 [Sphingobacteriales bacterium]|nr:MAG: hypothetical protein EOP49_01400 [Sphingobacteriales bacterium]
MRVIIKYLLLVMAFHGVAPDAFAQSLATQKAAKRYEVDAKRMGVDVNSEDALPRSREFKRIDSTYYVGWMFEGAYKYNHAADYLGFKNAAIPLEQALRLMERDYRKELGTRTSDLMAYFQVFKYHLDYTLTAYYLMTCYSNMEETEKVYALLRRVVRWNFQRDFYMDAYNYLGWTTHRNRFYTSSKYPFLLNSIDANERLAQRYLDSGMRRINRNMALNGKIFQPGYELQERLSVYHYKSMLYSYSFQVDSAAYYYDQLRKNNMLPHNNYATFRAICGDFREAEAEYRIEGGNSRPDKRLQEWVYYSSIIDVYKGRPRTGIELTRGMIQSNGSTPGFGWYNIAQARCKLYDGQNADAYRFMNKAAEFKELHIGTTLGQTHYDFSIQLLKLMHKLHQIEAQKFEHRNWWYNIPVLGRLARYKSEKLMQQFLIINQFSQNPERDRVVYKLFSTESTVIWDEVWYLIRDFSTGFFLEKFQKELNTDERKYIRKYFRYFVARLQMEKGNYKEANLILNQVLTDPDLDSEYEKLLIARTLQAQAECADEQENTQAYKDRMSRMYLYYPQLIPYSGLEMQMQMHVSGSIPHDFIERLKDCNIEWTTNGGSDAPQVYLSFSGSGTKRKVRYEVQHRGTTVVPQQALAFKKADDAVVLAYRLFNIGGKPPVPETDAERSTL